MQKHLNKILVFIINILLMAVAVLIIKDQDQNNIALKVEKTATLDPLDPKIFATQSAISADRENKLRALNTTPQELKKQQITTTTNTTTTKPSSSGSSSKTTKVS